MSTHSSANAVYYPPLHSVNPNPPATFNNMWLTSRPPVTSSVNQQISSLENNTTDPDSGCDTNSTIYIQSDSENPSSSSGDPCNAHKNTNPDK